MISDSVRQHKVSEAQIKKPPEWRFFHIYIETIS